MDLFCKAKKICLIFNLNIFFRQHDIRCKPSEASSVLLSFSSTDLGDTKNSEAKCLAINQARSEYLAVGLSDPFARIYDRRMIDLRPIRPRSSQNVSSSEINQK